MFGPHIQLGKYFYENTTKLASMSLADPVAQQVAYLVDLAPGIAELVGSPLVSGTDCEVLLELYSFAAALFTATYCRVSFL